MGRRISYQTKLYLCKKFYEACYHFWFVQNKVHNDLKLDNILISDCFSKLLLCDFGHTTQYNMVLRTYVGTPEYRAPEINEPAGPFSAAKAEVFAFASVLFALFFEKLPFSKMATSNDPLYKLVKGGEYEKFFASHNQSEETVI
jgi:serine/threonine protein kinase